MGYKVTAPLVVIANADGKSGDWYGYEGALVPAGLNDDRAKQLADEGMLEKVKAEKAADPDSKPATVDDILAEVGDDKEKAAAALEAENASDKPRVSLVGKLQAVLDAE